jgi:hypothetical protein
MYIEARDDIPLGLNGWIRHVVVQKFYLQKTKEH